MTINCQYKEKQMSV